MFSSELRNSLLARMYMDREDVSLRYAHGSNYIVMKLYCLPDLHVRHGVRHHSWEWRIRSALGFERCLCSIGFSWLWMRVVFVVICSLSILIAVVVEGREVRLIFLKKKEENRISISKSALSGQCTELLIQLDAGIWNLERFNHTNKEIQRFLKSWSFEADDGSLTFWLQKICYQLVDCGKPGFIKKKKKKKRSIP